MSVCVRVIAVIVVVSVFRFANQQRLVTTLYEA